MTDRYLTQQQKNETSRRAKKSQLCRWCGLDVHRLDKRRRTFCSPECVHEFNIRSSSSYIREYIGKRDAYTCQICGLECRGFIHHLRQFVKDQMVGLGYTEWQNRRKEFETEFFRQHGMEWVNTNSRSTFYDIDHILASSKGGNQCSEENLRVVCLRCHRIETAKLRTEMKRAKA